MGLPALKPGQSMQTGKSWPPSCVTDMFYIILKFQSKKQNVLKSLSSTKAFGKPGIISQQHTLHYGKGFRDKRPSLPSVSLNLGHGERCHGELRSWPADQEDMLGIMPPFWEERFLFDT